MSKDFSFACIALAFVFLSGCSKYETQYEGPYEDGGSVGLVRPDFVYEIVCVQDGKLYSTDKDLRVSKQLPTGEGVVEKASINYSHDRIAFKRIGANIQIIDTLGAGIATISNSTNVKWFDFHPNNQTLYMLTADNKITTFGPNVTLATTDAAAAVPILAQTDVNSIAVTSNGSVVISFESYSGFGFTNGVYYHATTGTGTRYLLFYYEFQESTRLRLTQDGTQGCANISYLGGSQPKASRFSISQNPTIFELGNSPLLGALSPDGSAAIIAGETSLYNAELGRQLSPGSGSITDLDW